MKKFLLILTAIAAFLLGTAAIQEAGAEEAPELTAECRLILGKNKNPKNLTDKLYTSQPGSTGSMKNPALTVSSDTPIYGIYLCFCKMPRDYEIQADLGNGWETVHAGNTAFYHAFYTLDGVQKVRVYANGDKKQEMSFNEIYVFGEGTLPAWVQRWEETPEKTDVLFVTGQPEEELLYLGGAIPYYIREKGKTVAVACFNCQNTARRSELLNGLWSMGCRYYPVIGDKDNKKENAERWVTETVRKCKPEVVVGPDEKGEGNNALRKALAKACTEAFSSAADEVRYPDSAASCGTWQTKKLYLHLYGEENTQTVFDWDTPMACFDGMTGNGMAYYAHLYHKTQDNSKEKTDKSVYNNGRKYANNRFGLKLSTVGEDTERLCFLENIPEEDLTRREYAKVPEWTIGEIPELPELNAKGFLDEGEFIWTDDSHGHYVYISPSMRIVIQRKHDGTLPLTWFVTDIRCDAEAGELMRNVEYSPEAPLGKKKTAFVSDNAMANKLVFATNADYYTYRLVNKNGKLSGSNGRPIGVEIRGGEVYFDSRYDHDEEKYFPNLDTLAFYRDGSMDVHHSVDLSAKEYLEKDAYLVYSFGPYLLKDGQMSAWVTDPTKSKAKNPRHCFGTVGPGHYVDILCEGRMARRSEGVTMPQTALLAMREGCTDCCNLDGGATGVLAFMGIQLNEINGESFHSSPKGRPVSEVLAIGVSEQVGSFEIK